MNTTENNDKKKKIIILGGILVLILALVAGLILVQQRQVPQKEAAEVTESGITCEWIFDPAQPNYEVAVVDVNGEVVQGLIENVQSPPNFYTFPLSRFNMSALPIPVYCRVSVPNIDMCVELSEPIVCPGTPTPSPTPALPGGCYSPCQIEVPSCSIEQNLECVYPEKSVCTAEGQGCYCWADHCDPSVTPTFTPSPSPTPTTSPSPTPTPPQQCLDECETDADCTDNMTCEDINGGEGESDMRCVVNEDCGNPDGGIPCWCQVPSPTPTVTPSPTSTPKPTTTPTICPIPNAVTNLAISCEPGRCSWTGSSGAIRYKVSVKNKDTDTPIAGFDPYINTNATYVNFTAEAGISYICYVEAENECGSSVARSSEICELALPTPTPRLTSTPAPTSPSKSTSTPVPVATTVKTILQPSSTPIPTGTMTEGTPSPTPSKLTQISPTPVPTLPQAGISARVQIMIAIAALGLLTAGLLLPLK